MVMRGTYSLIKEVWKLVCLDPLGKLQRGLRAEFRIGDDFALVQRREWDLEVRGMLKLSTSTAVAQVQPMLDFHLDPKSRHRL